MFKQMRIVPVLALLLSALSPATALAKVPFHAGQTRGADVGVYQETRTTAAERYRRAGSVIKYERLRECEHSHRYSAQHRM